MPETHEQLLQRAADALRQPPTEPGSAELALLFDLAREALVGAAAYDHLNQFVKATIDLARAFAGEVLDT